MEKRIELKERVLRELETIRGVDIISTKDGVMDLVWRTGSVLFGYPETGKFFTLFFDLDQSSAAWDMAARVLEIEA
jgi:hypothetical protein